MKFEKKEVTNTILWFVVAFDGVYSIQYMYAHCTALANSERPLHRVASFTGPAPE